MGFYSDLGTGVVAGLCQKTGFPMDRYGHLLDPTDLRSGASVKDWQKIGTKLFNFTNPYGFLEYVVGSRDDFHCFDYAIISAGYRGDFIILDATINSETGCFIDGASYDILPINSEDQKKYALTFSEGMADLAVEWCFDNEVKHSRKGWNQDTRYFVRCVAKTLFPERFAKVSDRQLRLGGKRLEKIMRELTLSHGVFLDVLDAQKV